LELWTHLSGTQVADLEARDLSWPIAMYLLFSVFITDELSKITYLRLGFSFDSVLPLSGTEHVTLRHDLLRDFSCIYYKYWRGSHE